MDCSLVIWQWIGCADSPQALSALSVLWPVG